MQSSWLVTVLGTGAFAAAVAHTFLAGQVLKLARKGGPHQGLWHLLGEVEVVFGFWGAVFLTLLGLFSGPGAAVAYIESISFTEPAFVFAIMIVASTKPVVSMATRLIVGIASRLPVPMSMAVCVTALTVGPLLGSFITEPAAMTVTALILYAVFFTQPLPNVLKYAMLGTLFVNISIGGVLTHFAAPPVIMSAPKWGWGLWHMFAHFGWKAAIAVIINATLLTAVFSGPLRRMTVHIPPEAREDIPAWICAVHLAALGVLVMLLHHPVAFLAVFVVFVGFVAAYEEHQSELMVRSSLLVGVFLAGLVILGPPQRWWVQTLLESMDAVALFYGSVALTAITDNAALTYLGTLVENLSDQSKFSLLAGAVTGGGLTVIANAPNPAGYSILKHGFRDGVINPLWLFVAALVPTAVAASAFLLFPN
ncbi:putative Na+/H+ antiporter [Fundidesulfovibrio putealis]|uniref:putative Na+/H+ antiporter n=1 Tax=Fundidesulfovibrio putealis TaxID=270496 RepID=UPI00041A5BE5|nr:putative Na+/H+ antiporter [Fundidesulfovibrio putealis]